MRLAALIALPLSLSAQAWAHSAAMKSPGPGMHFTRGQPLVSFADISDSREDKGVIVCPQGQTISNTQPVPPYDTPRAAQCSGGGTPVGWPQFQVKIDGVAQADTVSGLTTIPNTTRFNHDLNPDPIDFFRFSAPTGALGPGPHQLVVHAMFSVDGMTIDTLDTAPLTFFIDAPPAKPMVMLSADVNGPVNWDGVFVVGNGHAVTATGSLVIHD